MAESNVPSTQTCFSVKESAAQNEFILCSVCGEKNKWSMGQQERKGEGVARENRRKGYWLRSSGQFDLPVTNSLYMNKDHVYLQISLAGAVIIFCTRSESQFWADSTRTSQEQKKSHICINIVTCLASA